MTFYQSAELLAEHPGISVEKARDLWERAANIVDDDYNFDIDSGAYTAAVLDVVTGMLRVSDGIELDESLLDTIFGMRKNLRCKAQRCFHNTKGWCGLNSKEVTINGLHRCTRFTRT
ncbi:MAG: hypothetical protein DRP42_04550 [Tenericutes bacterium]|nr:MAG: hypothetical protein DRP42_04550 [Mycoplasmatota bacterium]